MKLKNEFITHISGGKHILVSTVDNGFSGLVRSNETAGFIIEQMKTDTTVEKIADALLKEYDVDRERATWSVKAVIDKLNSIGALEA